MLLATAASANGQLPQAWRSADGLHWTGIPAVEPLPSGALTRQTQGRTEVSVDGGAQWATLPGPTPTENGPPPWGPTAVSRVDGTWWLMASRSRAEHTRYVALFRSEGGRHWERVDLPGPDCTSRFVEQTLDTPRSIGHGWLVAVASCGRSTETETRPIRTQVIASNDGGRTWRTLPLDDSVADGFPSAIASRRDHVTVVVQPNHIPPGRGIKAVTIEPRS